MLKDITLGQYFPGKSIIHKLDPRIKIILTVLFIIMIFSAKSVSGFIFISFFTVVIVAVSEIPVKTILKGIKPLIYVIAFTGIINIFFTKGEVLILHFWVINIYMEGIMYALLMIIRIVVLLVGTCVILTYTTSPIALTDGIERLLAPLKILKIPVHEFAMMMTIALRFIPTLIEETDKIMNAQKARGVDFSSGNLIQRAKALLPVIIPLFVSAFRRADDLATAMECRCYHGGEGRTKMTVTKLRMSDVVAVVLFAAAIAAVVAINSLIPVYLLF